MTTRTWNGTNDSYNNAAAWSPAGIPISGDTAIINAGTVSLSTNPSGVAIQLTEASGSTTATTLSLSNTVLDASSSLTMTNNNPYNSTAPQLSIAGTVTLGGTESFYGSKIVFSISSGSTLINSGTLNFYSSSLVTNGGGTLQNGGTIAIVNPGAAPRIPVLADAITGTGTIALGKYGRLELSNAVSAGQTIIMNDGASGNQTLQLDQISTFGATISGFSSSDLISVVTNVAFNPVATYTSTGSNTGTLNLFSGATLVKSIALQGQFTSASFLVVSNALGDGTFNNQITTTAVNAVSAGLPAGYQNGGSGAGVGAVYRFFDTRFGTHFFTSDIGERNTVLASRTDLTQETNGFGAVAQTDPNAVAVYRFFDKNFGTHFFTANAGERDSVIAARPDLTYEAGSTFYEHATQQSGDTAVYRLFDQRTGTQFLTGDQGEYAGITTPTSATYRSDLRAEGVAFYAPVGTFT